MRKEEQDIQDIHGTDWTCLVVLDACRYDTLEKVYSDYFRGHLHKKISRGSNTPQWLERTFPDWYDYSYISANPFVNSKGIKISECNKSFNSIWKAKDHFKLIVDSWLLDWDEQLKAIHPKAVVNRALKYPCDKIIVHLMQPHAPYLSCKEEITRKLDEKHFGQIASKTRTKIWMKLPLRVLKLLSGFLSFLPFKLKCFFMSLIGEETYFCKIALKGGTKKIQEYYEDNLRTALQCIKLLVQNQNGKVIVTSDHGEALGESGRWGHNYDDDHSILRTVPWLEIDSVIGIEDETK